MSEEPAPAKSNLKHVAEMTELVVFRSELLHICKLAQIAAADLDTAIKEDDYYRIWLSLHALLTLAADVSKILCGTKGKSLQRGERLRTAFSIKDLGALEDRDLRNYFEHIDGWIGHAVSEVRKRGRGGIADRPLLSKRRTDVRLWVDQVQTLRSFDPAERKIYAGDEHTLSIDALAAAFTEVRQKLEAINAAIQVSIPEEQDAVDAIYECFQQIHGKEKGSAD